MMPELVKRKTTRLFGLVDANIDGVIEHDDIEKICFNVAKAVGAEPGTAQYSTIQRWYEGAWEPGLLTRLADSPMRRRIAHDLVTGATATFVLIESRHFQGPRAGPRIRSAAEAVPSFVLRP